MTTQSIKTKNILLWGGAGCLALVLVAFCILLVISGVVLAPRLLATPTPAIARGSFVITLRYLEGVSTAHVERLADRLETLGYPVNVENATGTSGWSYPQSAFLYGAPACLEAIEDIQAQAGDLANLSTLPAFRFVSDDAMYNRYSIVIQILEDDYWVP
ncbi:MAG: hypothetical protein JXB85_11235 [Anaerolineales bacterium]|nr:hypothetical protein [Anaerolineales bacterium]